jgi:diguanylate cyclase (GGDEF)-like protein
VFADVGPIFEEVEVAEEQEASSTRSDAEADENALITVLDAIAVALSAPDGEATSPGSIRELTGFATHILAETLGGSAVLWLKDDSGRLELFASADQDPTTDNLLLRALKGARPLAGGGLVGRVLDAGGPLEASQTTWRELLEWDQAGLCALLDGLGALSAFVAPVRARSEVVGALLFSRSAPKRGPSGLERTVLQDVADQIGLARAYVSQVSARANAESLVLEREARLRSSASRQAALADLGRWALVGLGYPNLVEDAVSLLTEQLGVDFVHVFEAMADTSFVTMTASRGHRASGPELLSTDPTSSPVSFALVTQETVICDDLALEARFEVPDLWVRSEAMSVIEAPIPGQDSPAGVLGVGCRSPRLFSEEDVNFVVAVANVLAAAAARIRAENAIRDQALHDPLTGLPNRLVLADHGHAVAVPTQSELSGVKRTVLVVDIDRFKEVNDTLGYALGDLVLLEVARRLHGLGDPVEIVARLGGDEFAVVASGVTEAVDPDGLATRLLAALSEAIEVGGVRLRLRASVGVAEADVDEAGASLGVPALLRRAEVAMYQAKADRRGIRRYSDDLERSSLSRLELAGELADAIDKGEFRLDYQPKVDSLSRLVTGVEALVRWRHPTRGLLVPDAFIPLAEQTGMIRELTNWVLAKALSECSGWHRGGHFIPVAVNLSAATVHDPELMDAVTTAVSRSGLPPRSIELEITESAIMFDPEGALRSLESLVEYGVKLSLDDFGTGYSSLSYLQRLPVTAVKIDKSFVEPLLSDGTARAIVRSVVELAHGLGLSVIAEGVDSAAVMDQLTAIGCDALQGFYIANPMSPARLEEWIATNSTVAAERSL